MLSPIHWKRPDRRSWSFWFKREKLQKTVGIQWDWWVGMVWWLWVRVSRKWPSTNPHLYYNNINGCAGEVFTVSHIVWPDLVWEKWIYLKFIGVTPSKTISGKFVKSWPDSLLELSAGLWDSLKLLPLDIYTSLTSNTNPNLNPNLTGGRWSVQSLPVPNSGHRILTFTGISPDSTELLPDGPLWSQTTWMWGVNIVKYWIFFIFLMPDFPPWFPLSLYIYSNSTLCFLFQQVHCSG